MVTTFGQKQFCNQHNIANYTEIANQKLFCVCVLNKFFFMVSEERCAEIDMLSRSLKINMVFLFSFVSINNGIYMLKISMVFVVLFFFLGLRFRTILIKCRFFFFFCVLKSVLCKF